MTATKAVIPKPSSFGSLPNSSRCPDFFIVGAPRCGTTALHRWLRQHPRVYLPSIKECHYFATDLERFRTIHTQQEYLRLFRDVGSHHQAVGEASVMYLSSQFAIKNIHRFNPDARIIVTLRNPLTMLPSWHDQLLVTLQEDVTTFEKAWAMQAERRGGRAIPSSCTVPQSLQYSAIGQLGAQVSRLLQQFDKQQIHFVVYDDLSQHPDATYKILLQRLGVDFDGRSDFSKVNRNREISSAWLRRFWQRNRLARQRLQVIRKVLGDSLYDRARDFVMPRLSRPKHRGQLSASMREMLRAEFCEDVALLSDLVGRDFSHWLHCESA
ncbi:MAG: sulfotransferase [Pirellulales bacterium]|nr:sulfotransferase [Pirellulales bacterium]